MHLIFKIQVGKPVPLLLDKVVLGCALEHELDLLLPLQALLKDTNAVDYALEAFGARVKARNTTVERRMALNKDWLPEMFAHCSLK